VRFSPGVLLAWLAGAPRWLVGGALIALFAVDAYQGGDRLPLVAKLEAIAYDARLALTRAGTGDPQVVIVDIDEASLAREGRWPWPRDRVAKLVAQLFERYQVRAVGFDVLFAERDTSGGVHVLEDLALSKFKDSPLFTAALTELRPRLDYDARFAEAMRGRPVVLGIAFTDTTNTAGRLPVPAFTQADLGTHEIRIAPERGYTGNIPELARAAAGGGHIDPVFDVDNVIRRVPLVKRYNDAFYPALALATARIVVEAKGIVPRFDDNGDLDAFDLGGLVVPASREGLALVPYRGGPKTFRYIRAADVLDGTTPPDFAGAVVLVGTTAKGLQDIRSTPFAPDFPGVEIHANLLSGMLNDELKAVPAGARAVETLVMLVAGLLAVFVIPWRRPLFTVAGIFVVAALVTAVNLWFWTQQKSVVPLAATLALLLTLMLYNLLTGFVREARATRTLSDLFGEYVPPERVRQMRESGESFSMEGESRELTVLFSDVREFTAVSESLAPRELSALMNAYLTPMTEVIHRSRGTIDKYIGDAIMAFWGAPLANPRHAHDAVAAALAMRDRVATLRVEFAQRGWPPLAIGIGLNSGTMNVGDMGSRFRKAYTVLGDAVNLGSRLEGLTKLYGVTILCGEDTRIAAPEFVWREVDRVRVKGRAKPLAIYEPLGEKVDAETARQLDAWHAALARYRARDFAGAAPMFSALAATASGTALPKLFGERCATLASAPPPADWDGATSFTVK